MLAIKFLWDRDFYLSQHLFYNKCMIIKVWQFVFFFMSKFVFVFVCYRNNMLIVKYSNIRESDLENETPPLLLLLPH